MNPRRTDPELGQDAPQAANEAAPDTDDDIDAGAAEAPDAAPDSESNAAVDAGVPVEGDDGSKEEAEDSEAVLERELRDAQDRLLRMAAEYENFRKRTARERADLWSRAQAEVVSGILDGLDDFRRVLELDVQSATAADVVSGVELVERKLVRELERAGLERVGEVGEVFDPNHHEAIGSLPAEAEEQDHTVGAVFQLGYKFGGTLIRPARVQVYMWSGAGGQGGE